MTTQEIGKRPLPHVLDIDREFWEALKNNKFLIQKCLDCNRLQFPARAVCLDCFSTNLGWQESKGTGTIYSFTIVRAPLFPADRKRVTETGVPFMFARIDMDDGVRVASQIVGCKPEEVEIRGRVKVTFENLEGSDFKLPFFHLIK